jgi:3-isopropylmalate/(R)-2-methylmalate dehydratase small subunit
VGLPLLICDTDAIDEGDELEVDLASGKVHNMTKGTQLASGRMAEVMLRILEEGGLVEYIKKYGDFELP